MFEYQPPFATNKRGVHLAGQAFHPVKDGFPFTAPGKLYFRVGKGDREKLQASKFASF